MNQPSEETPITASELRIIFQSLINQVKAMNQDLSSMHQNVLAMKEDVKDIHNSTISILNIFYARVKALEDARKN